MDTTAPNGAENGRVLALAGVAAGIIGGLLMALGGRGKQKQAATQVTVTATVPAGLADSAQHFREDVGARVSEQLQHAAARGKEAQKAAKRRQKEMKKRKAKATSKSLLDQARDMLAPVLPQQESSAQKVQKAARQQVAQLSQQGASVGAQARTRLDQLSQQSQGSLNDLRQRTVELAHASADKAQESARSLSHSASERGQAVASNVAPQVQALKSTVPAQVQALKETVVPQVQTAKSGAEDRVEELIAQGKERAAQLIKGAETDVLPAVKQFATQAIESLEKLPEAISDELPGVKDRAGHLKETASDRAASAQQQVQQLKSTASDRAAATQQHVGDTAKQVATSTTEGGKDFGSLLTWLALGGALVYFVFLEEKQREHIRALANRALHSAIETYRDIQGFDQEFA